MLFNAMTIMIKFVACVIGLLIYTVVVSIKKNYNTFKYKILKTGIITIIIIIYNYRILKNIL